MTCGEFEDRLYDEDARVAQLGGGLAPADVAAHIAHCPDCGASWARTSAETRRLVHVMIVSPTPALRRTLRQAYRSAKRPRIHWLDVQVLSCVVTGGALGAGLAVSLATSTAGSQWAGFCLGATCALISTALRRMRSIWRAPWALVRSVLAL
jgi:hypothetical protein